MFDFLIHTIWVWFFGGPVCLKNYWPLWVQTHNATVEVVSKNTLVQDLLWYLFRFLKNKVVSLDIGGCTDVATGIFLRQMMMDHLYLWRLMRSFVHSWGGCPNSNSGALSTFLVRAYTNYSSANDLWNV